MTWSCIAPASARSPGEIADVILSDAESSFLALYPVLLLVGTQPGC